MLFDQNPLTVITVQAANNVIEFPDPVDGEKHFLLVMKLGQLKINTQGPLNQHSTILDAANETKRMFFKTDRKKIICYIEGMSEEVSFVLSQI